ncbi:chemotaxis protein CheX [Anaerocolumna sp. MB42-C2]|uniref:chemotaxis protein CheX n=1 Tax=Anaerocolumna sp. MB42-C2 TaxID=3070997 RepID=UPI0027E00860|nr:chemotaxis protein CheX [Anaerocolumna sp. MB42-C2]WMJ87012.1 chemotaxis protein CheX [Anaerocolumna sp. MB42-C2]
MDVKLVNPFMEAFTAIMPQLGFNDIRKGELSVKTQEINCSGVVVIVGIVGVVKGNVVYSIDSENAIKIASTMMMGMSISKLDEMSKSALSELANMLTANAATCFSTIGMQIDISTPTLLYGENIEVKMSSSQVLCVRLLADEIPIDINIAFEK